MKILETNKIGIAMSLIEDKIGICMAKIRTTEDTQLKKELEKLLLERENIYKGNYETINKIINERKISNN